MNVLVTGGSGYIGSHTTAKLVEQGYSVTVLDNLSTGFERLTHPQAKFVRGNVRDEKLVEKVILENSVEAIIHFAAFTSVAESVRNPEKYYENNFGGTLGVLKAIQNAKTVKNLIFSSTAAVYSDPGKNKVTENSSVMPGTPYGKSKWMSEQAIQDFCVNSDLKATILRYFNVAGASKTGQLGQIGDEHTVLVKRAALAAVGKISELEIFGTDYPTPDGTAVRDYIHVEDLADLHILALKRSFSGILNCGYGQGFSVRQVIDMMKKVSGADFKTVEKGQRPGDLPSVVADNSQILNQFHWQPRYNDLEIICRSAFNWEVSEIQSKAKDQGK